MLGSVDVQYYKFCGGKKWFSCVPLPRNLNLPIDQIIFVEACSSQAPFGMVGSQVAIVNPPLVAAGRKRTFYFYSEE